MIYLANPVGAKVRGVMATGALGQMATPRAGERIIPGAPWALDNGCFSAKWTPVEYFRALDRYASVPGCLFAVVPDVVADAAGTNRLWGKCWDLGLRRRGYPVAYVIQDGATSIPRWCDAVFVGGSTEWKLGEDARRLVALAKRHDKWVHMGRVNSLKRLRYADEIGCDSADGTFLVFDPTTNLPRLLGWLDAINGTELVREHLAA